MSLYRRPGSPFWHYDFVRHGRRFFGSTKARAKAAAREVERRAEAAAERQIAAERAAEAAFKGQAPLTVDLAAGRWWHEVGQHNVNAASDWRNLERLVAHFGPARRLDEIGDADVAAWVAARRGERVVRRWKKRPKKAAPEKLVSAATVNRSTVDVLRRLFVRARKVWKLPLAGEPDWKQHRLAESRKAEEIRAVDEEAIVAALHEGYAALFRFAIASGLRLRECLIRKDQVDWVERTLTVVQKGGRKHVQPISAAMARILRAEWSAHPDWVFAYVARRARRGAAPRSRGERYPITYSGIKTEWRRVVRGRLALPDRFHAARHTRATRLIRRTGDLKAAQEMLGHSDITTTAAYYAHAMLEDVRAKVDAADEAASESRNSPRTRPA
jgi:integrase